MSDIPIQFQHNPSEPERHAEIVRDTLKGLNEKERDIVASRLDRIVITGDDIGVRGQYRPRTRSVTFSTVQNKSYEIPVFMRPYMNDARAMITHELNHPLFEVTGSPSKHHDREFAEARKQAQARIMTDPEIAPKVEQILSGMRKWMDTRTDKSFLNIDFGWDKLEPNNRQQLGVLLGVYLSDEYHETYPYSANPMIGRRDTRYDEILCNLRGLTAAFGEEQTRSFAGELMDYANDRVNKRGEGQDTVSDRPGMSAIERILMARRNGGHGGYGGGGSRSC
jgi:hypothetical protein